MKKKLWEIWEYTSSPPRMVDVRRGRKEAVDRAKQLAQSARLWFRTHKVYPAGG